MTISITQMGENEIEIRHRASYGLIVSLGLLMVIVTLFLLLMNPKGTQILVAIVPVSIAGYQIWSARGLVTIINKDRKTLQLHKSGVLGTKFDARNEIRSVMEINGLEIKRFVGRSSDRFKIRIVVKSAQYIHEEIYLTNDLSFSDVTQYSEQIHQFLGKEIPLKAVD